ncbi:MAG: putative entry exclusion protein TrbK-alt [Bradyrhizobium sp.]|nr:putative entry exclusion protein TrbK-alt [Bradyrhizobium sp.]
MKKTMLNRLPTMAAMVLIVLIVAACAIRLRDDENQNMSARSSLDQAVDPLAAKLGECRSVTSEQKDALSECRKAWTEQRRQFLGQNPPRASSDKKTSEKGSSIFVLPKDRSRLSPASPSIPQSEQE